MIRTLGDITTAVPGWIGAGAEAATPSVNADFPAYCDWLLFADHLPACQVPTAAVQNAAIQRDIEKAAGGDTETAAAEYEQYLADVAALAKIDPEGAAQYKFAGENPHLAALLGANPFGRAVGSAANAATDLQNWLGVPSWVWLLGGFGTLALVLRGGIRR